jgi:hypothetical protein
MTQKVPLLKRQINLRTGGQSGGGLLIAFCPFRRYKSGEAQILTAKSFLLLWPEILRGVTPACFFIRWLVSSGV